MEAAADVLLGMAAEKIQVLVIHLSPIHTHTHTGVHCLLFSFFYKLSYKHTCMKDALTQTHRHKHTHTDTPSVYNLSLCPSLCLSHHWHSPTPLSFCCPLLLFILNHKRYQHSTTNTASWDNPERLIHKNSHHNDIYWFLMCKFMYNVLHSVKSQWLCTGVL